MGLNYKSLPAAMQAQVDAQLAAQTAPSEKGRPSRATARASMSARCECGATFTNENQMNRHPAGPGHCRVEIIAAADTS